MRRTESPFVVRLASDWTFFGLTASYKVIVYDQIFDLVFHGKGFSYQDVLDMPVYLRTYYIHKINKFYEDQNKAQEKANKAQNTNSSRARPPRF